MRPSTVRRRTAGVGRGVAALPTDVLSLATSYWRAADYNGDGVLEDGKATGRDLTVNGSPAKVGNELVLDTSAKYLSRGVDDGSALDFDAWTFSLVVAFRRNGHDGSTNNVLVSKRAADPIANNGWNISILNDGKVYGLLAQGGSFFQPSAPNVVVTNNNPYIAVLRRNGSGQGWMTVRSVSALTDGSQQNSGLTSDSSAGVRVHGHNDGNQAQGFNWFGSAVFKGTFLSDAQIATLVQEFGLV